MSVGAMFHMQKKIDATKRMLRNFGLTGAINEVPPAAALVKSMMEELVSALQMMGKQRETFVVNW